MATTTLVSILILIAFGDFIAYSFSEGQQRNEFPDDRTGD